MQISIEKSKGLNRRLKIKVPAQEVDPKVEERLKEIAKTVKMDGFRPGKVPYSIVKSHYQDVARHDITGKVLEETFRKAIEQEKLKVAGRPQIEVTVSEMGKDLEYLADVEIYPEIQLKDFEKVTIEQVKTELGDKDIDRVLERMQKQYAEWQKVERAAQEEDRVIIDFEGFIDKKAFEGGKAEKVPLILGSNTMIPGFEKGIIGAKPGDVLDVKVTFPKEYPEKELAGKKAVFKVNVHEVWEPQLPELNDAFAQKLGIKEGGLEKLREKMRQSMEKEQQDALKIKNKKNVMDKILELNKIELPKVFVEAEIDHLYQQANQQFQSYTKSKQNISVPRDHFREDAERRVALGLLIGEYVKKFNIEPDDERVRNSIEQFSKTFEHPEQIVDWYYQDPQRLFQFQTLAVEDQVVEKLLEQANIKEKQLTYEELLAG
ncbi:MAG: trigger factor [Gammaproteobacteria bacterium]|nr:trigger factor [Gammaproteobacteria bacterium]